MLEWVNGGLLLERTVYNPKKHLGGNVFVRCSIVLAVLPHNHATPFVTWEEMTNLDISDLSTYAIGDYHRTAMEAVSTYVERCEKHTHAQANRDAITKRATDDAKAAASWFEVNTTEEARKILNGLDDCDPETLDLLPHPRLGGEWADDPTWDDIMMDEVHGLDAQDEPVLQDHPQYDELLTLYEDVFSTKVPEFIEAKLLEHVGVRD